jgi:hypothetical protein
MAFVPGIQPPQATPEILTTLDLVHQRIRICTNPAQLAALLTEYSGLVSRLGGGALVAAQLAAPFIPGGAVVRAAVTGSSAARGASGA